MKTLQIIIALIMLTACVNVKNDLKKAGTDLKKVWDETEDVLPVYLP